MRSYEAMFIFQPHLDEERLEKEIKNVTRIIKDNGVGNINIENIGKKTFAYPVGKYNEGYYVCYNFQADPLSISKIKEALKHRGTILRFIIFLKKERKR